MPFFEHAFRFRQIPDGFQQVTLKVLRWEEPDKRLIIKEAQIVG